MKIEKISDNQIRCTLTREDLELHHIKLSELAYGTDKARNLFQEMMQMAYSEVGFEVDNTPLMIEAIPMNTDSIMLLITKVEDPEELDTRFSKFAPFHRDTAVKPLQLDGADDILGLFQKLRDAAKHISESKKASEQDKESIPGSASGKAAESAKLELIRDYHFNTLDHLISASHGLGGLTQGPNKLYKDPAGGYRLILHQGACSPEDFNRVCNILAEYGSGKPFTPAAEAFLGEHGDLVMKDALRKLCEL